MTQTGATALKSPYTQEGGRGANGRTSCLQSGEELARRDRDRPQTQWDAATSILTCRVVNRGAGRPNLIIGYFVDYLLRRQRRRIKLLTVLPG
jgi:hypothetical protein